MNDTKNILLACVSHLGSLFAATDSRELTAILSAIILPTIFFAVGKLIDVLLQIYFRRHKD